MRSLASHGLRWVIKYYAAPRLTGAATIEEQRRIMAELDRRATIPRGAIVEPTDKFNVPCEWVAMPGAFGDRVILFLHGGGFVMGLRNGHRGMAARLSRVCRARCLVVDYRLAPEHPYPAAPDDCLTVYKGLLEQGYDPAKITIAGDSAGGNLTVTTSIRARDQGLPLPAAGICFSPATDATYAGPTFEGLRKLDPMLTPEWVRMVVDTYTGDDDGANPEISPLLANHAGLQPLLIQVGTDEILLSDSTRLADKARASGVEVSLELYDGMWHVWQSFAPMLPEAVKAIESAGRFVRKHMR